MILVGYLLTTAVVLLGAAVLGLFVAWAEAGLAGIPARLQERRRIRYERGLVPPARPDEGLEHTAWELRRRDRLLLHNGKDINPHPWDEAARSRKDEDQSLHRPKARALRPQYRRQ